MIVIALDSPTEPEDRRRRTVRDEQLQRRHPDRQVRPRRDEGQERSRSRCSTSSGFVGRGAPARRLPEGLRHQGRQPADRLRRQRAGSDALRRRPRWRTACRGTRTSTSSTRSTSRARPAPGRPEERRQEAGRDVTIVSVDGGCAGVAQRQGRRSSTRPRSSIRCGWPRWASGGRQVRQVGQEGVRLHGHRRQPDHRRRPWQAFPRRAWPTASPTAGARRDSDEPRPGRASCAPVRRRRRSRIARACRERSTTTRHASEKRTADRGAGLRDAPAVGPLLALIATMAFFSLKTRSVPAGAEPLARAAAGDGRRRARDRADARDPDRRHRPVRAER